MRACASPTGYGYHQKVRLWRASTQMRREDLGSFEVVRERRSEMCIVEEAKVLWLRRIVRANLSRLDREIGLP